MLDTFRKRDNMRPTTPTQPGSRTLGNPGVQSPSPAGTSRADSTPVKPVLLDPPAPAPWRFLRRWRAGTRLHGRIWYRIVGHAIDDWQRAVGMNILRRVGDSTHASVTYLVLPGVQGTERSRFAWRAQSD